MSTQLKSRHRNATLGAAHRRAAWRQKLVEAERGIARGVRSDSTFFFHAFVASMIVAAGFVLGLARWEWSAVILAMTMVMSAEMFQQVLKAIWRNVGHHFDEPAQQSLRIGTAAVFICMIGAILVIGMIFTARVWQLVGA